MRRLDGQFPVWEIIPRKLFQCGETTYHRPANRKMKGLVHYGITHMVAFAPKKPDPDLELWSPDIFKYIHFPITDGQLKECTGLALIQIAAQMAEEIKAGGCVLTMCSAGRNRSGLMSALIVRKVLGISGADAMDHVRVERPDALANDHFAKFLRELP
jgi:protein-tyrosine phosphatase